jgi:predicted transcriptional regulator
MTDHKKLRRLTADIVTSYIGAQFVRPSDLADLIQKVHGALDSLAGPMASEPSFAQSRPMAQVRATIRPRGQVSIQDRRTFQLLRRRLEAQGL